MDEELTKQQLEEKDPPDGDDAQQLPKASNVVAFKASQATKEAIEDLDPEDFEEVVIVGRLKNGETYFSASSDYLPGALWLLQTGIWSLQKLSSEGD